MFSVKLNERKKFCFTSPSLLKKKKENVVATIDYLKAVGMISGLKGKTYEEKLKEPYLLIFEKSHHF